MSNVPAAKSDAKVESPVTESVVLVAVDGTVTHHDSVDDAFAAWASNSSHVTKVLVPRKDDDE